MKRKVLFIINPISGGKNKDGVPALIKKHLDPAKFEYRIDISTGVLHAQQLAQQNLEQFDIIVAVGGDGTINEVASVIVGTDTIFGVIPYGSGNGLSRFLGIPMDPEEAIKNLAHARTEKIDTAKLNGRYFFNMAGMGFDAHISEVFSHDKNRGFGAYIKSSFSEVMNYKPATYQIDIDGRRIHREAFMLSFANSSQYGNNAHVSPYASVQDGLFDVCVIKPFPLWKFIYMGLLMFTRTADRSKYVEIIRGKHITVTRDHEGPIHLDGEPMVMGTKIDIEVMPGTLNIIVGSNYKA